MSGWRGFSEAQALRYIVCSVRVGGLGFAVWSSQGGRGDRPQLYIWELRFWVGGLDFGWLRIFLGRSAVAFWDGGLKF